LALASAAAAGPAARIAPKARSGRIIGFIRFINMSSGYPGRLAA
jgi:hypothetical protein